MGFKWRSGWESAANRSQWAKLAQDAEEKKKAREILIAEKNKAIQLKRQAAIDARIAAVNTKKLLPSPVVTSSRGVAVPIPSSTEERESVLRPHAVPVPIRGTSHYTPFERDSGLSDTWLKGNLHSPRTEEEDRIKEEDRRKRDELQKTLRALRIPNATNVTLSLILHPNSVVPLEAFEDPSTQTIVERVRAGDYSYLTELKDKANVNKILSFSSGVLASKDKPFIGPPETNIAGLEQTPRWRDFLNPVGTRQLVNELKSTWEQPIIPAEAFSRDKVKQEAAVLALNTDQKIKFIDDWINAHQEDIQNFRPFAPVPVLGERFKPELTRLVETAAREGRKLTDEEFEQAFGYALMNGFQELPQNFNAYTNIMKTVAPGYLNESVVKAWDDFRTEFRNKNGREPTNAEWAAKFGNNILYALADKTPTDDMGNPAILDMYEIINQQELLRGRLRGADDAFVNLVKLAAAPVLTAYSLGDEYFAKPAWDEVIRPALSHVVAPVLGKYLAPVETTISAPAIAGVPGAPDIRGETEETSRQILTSGIMEDQVRFAINPANLIFLPFLAGRGLSLMREGRVAEGAAVMADELLLTGESPAILRGALRGFNAVAERGLVWTIRNIPGLKDNPFFLRGLTQWADGIDAKKVTKFATSESNLLDQKRQIAQLINSSNPSKDLQLQYFDQALVRQVRNDLRKPISQTTRTATFSPATTSGSDEAFSNVSKPIIREVSELQEELAKATSRRDAYYLKNELSLRQKLDTAVPITETKLKKLVGAQMNFGMPKTSTFWSTGETGVWSWRTDSYGANKALVSRNATNIVAFVEHNGKRYVVTDVPMSYFEAPSFGVSTLDAAGNEAASGVTPESLAFGDRGAIGEPTGYEGKDIEFLDAEIENLKNKWDEIVGNKPLYDFENVDEYIARTGKQELKEVSDKLFNAGGERNKVAALREGHGPGSLEQAGKPLSELTEKEIQIRKDEIERFADQVDNETSEMRQMQDRGWDRVPNSETTLEQDIDQSEKMYRGLIEQIARYDDELENRMIARGEKVKKAALAQFEDTRALWEEQDARAAALRAKNNVENQIDNQIDTHASNVDKLNADDITMSNPAGRKQAKDEYTNLIETIAYKIGLDKPHMEEGLMTAISNSYDTVPALPEGNSMLNVAGEFVELGDETPVDMSVKIWDNLYRSVDDTELPDSVLESDIVDAVTTRVMDETNHVALKWEGDTLSIDVVGRISDQQADAIITAIKDNDIKNIRFTADTVYGAKASEKDIKYFGKPGDDFSNILQQAIDRKLGKLADRIDAVVSGLPGGTLLPPYFEVEPNQEMIAALTSKFQVIPAGTTPPVGTGVILQNGDVIYFGTREDAQHTLEIGKALLGRDEVDLPEAEQQFYKFINSTGAITSSTSEITSNASFRIHRPISFEQQRTMNSIIDSSPGKKATLLFFEGNNSFEQPFLAQENILGGQIIGKNYEAIQNPAWENIVKVIKQSKNVGRDYEEKLTRDLHRASGLIPGTGDNVVITNGKFDGETGTVVSVRQNSAEIQLDNRPDTVNVSIGSISNDVENYDITASGAFDDLFDETKPTTTVSNVEPKPVRKPKESKARYEARVSKWEADKAGLEGELGALEDIPSPTFRAYGDVLADQVEKIKADVATAAGGEGLPPVKPPVAQAGGEGELPEEALAILKQLRELQFREEVGKVFDEGLAKTANERAAEAFKLKEELARFNIKSTTLARAFADELDEAEGLAKLFPGREDVRLIPVDNAYDEVYQGLPARAGGIDLDTASADEVAELVGGRPVVKEAATTATSAEQASALERAQGLRRSADEVLSGRSTIFKGTPKEAYDHAIQLMREAETLEKSAGVDSMKLTGAQVSIETEIARKETLIAGKAVDEQGNIIKLSYADRRALNQEVTRLKKQLKLARNIKETSYDRQLAIRKQLDKLRKASRESPKRKANLAPTIEQLEKDLAFEESTSLYRLDNMTPAEQIRELENRKANAIFKMEIAPSDKEVEELKEIADKADRAIEFIKSKVPASILAEEEADIARTIYNDALSTMFPEINLLRSELNNIEKRLKGLMALPPKATGGEEIPLIQRRSEIIKKMSEMRADASDATSALVTPTGEKILTAADFERVPFARGWIGQAFEDFLATKYTNSAARTIIPVLRSIVGAVDPSFILSSDILGRKIIALKKMENYAHGLSIEDANFLVSLGEVKDIFKGRIDKDGLVHIADGLPREFIGDMAENWSKFSKYFNDEQTAYIEGLLKVKDNVFKFLRAQGIKNIPNEWGELDRVFRTVKSAGDGLVDLSKARQGMGSKNVRPSSLHERAYETMLDGFNNGIVYEANPTIVMATKAMAIRKWAVNQAFLQEMGERGVASRLIVAHEYRVIKAMAAKEVTWAQRISHFAHDSLRGGVPTRATLRDAQNLDVPEELITLRNQIDELNKKNPADKNEQMKVLVAKADEILKENKAKFKIARSELIDAQKRYADSALTLEATKWGRPGERLPVRNAPHTWSPMRDKIFLEEDIKYLNKHYDSAIDNWAAAFGTKAAHLANPFRTLKTVVDFGFWLTTGLPVLGHDLVNAFGIPEAIATASPGKIKSIWAEGTWQSLRAFRNKQWAAKWWMREAQLNPGAFARFRQYTRIGGLPDGLGSTGVVPNVWGVREINRGVAFFERSFTQYLNGTAWLYFKSLDHLTEGDPKKLEQLGAMARNIVGIHSGSELGIHYGQQGVERLLFFAPSFFRASLSIMANAMFQGNTFAGRQALKSLAGLSMAMSMAVAGYTLAKQGEANGYNPDKIDWGDLSEELQESWKPWNGSRFWAIRAGDGFIGLGGAMRSNLQIMGRLLHEGIDWNPTDPTNFEFDFGKALGIKFDPDDPIDSIGVDLDSPIAKWFRGKTSVPLGLAWNIASGEDYLGYKIDGIKDASNISQLLAPFWLQNYIQANGGLFETPSKGAIASTLAEFLGARTGPVTPRQHMEEVFLHRYEEETGEVLTWEELNDGTHDETLRDYKEDRIEHPDTTKAWSEYEIDRGKKGSQGQQFLDRKYEIFIERDKKIAEAAAEIDWSVPGSGEKFAQEVSDIYTTYSNDVRTIAVDIFGEDEADSFLEENKDDTSAEALLQDYLNNIDQFRDPVTNEIDWERRAAAIDEQVNKLIPQNRADYLENGVPHVGRFDANAYDNKMYDYVNEAMTRKKEAGKVLNEWLNTPKYVGMTVEESDRVESLLDMVTKARQMLEVSTGKAPSEKSILQKLNKLIPGNKIIQYALISKYDALRNMITNHTQEDLLMRNPDVVIFYPWTLTSWSISDETREAWSERWGMGQNVWHSKIHREVFQEEE